MINYVKGDATQPTGDGNKIIAHVTNNEGGWGAGFVVAISKRWKQPEIAYRSWGRPYQLGTVQTIQVENDLWVANMCAQNGLGGFIRGAKPLVSYTQLTRCLWQLHKRATVLNASIHMPRIGAGLGGGDWNVIELIIKDTLRNHCVTIYDLEKK